MTLPPAEHVGECARYRKPPPRGWQSGRSSESLVLDRAGGALPVARAVGGAVVPDDRRGRTPAAVVGGGGVCLVRCHALIMPPLAPHVKAGQQKVRTFFGARRREQCQQRMLAYPSGCRPLRTLRTPRLPLSRRGGGSLLHPPMLTIPARGERGVNRLVGDRELRDKIEDLTIGEFEREAVALIGGEAEVDPL